MVAKTGPASQTRLARAWSHYAALAPARGKSYRAYRNWMRAIGELQRRPTVIRAHPLKLSVDPTNVCQLRCPLCPTGLGINERIRKHADLGAFEKLLEEIGDDLFLLDLCNWGEPLLNPKLEGFIAAANRRGIATRISTNLSVELDDRRLRSLVESGLGEIVVSLDGASQVTYETYRRRGDFELVVRNLRRLVEIRRKLGQRSPWIVWKFLVFSWNEHERDLASELAREIGVDRFFLEPPALEHDRYPLSDEDRKAVESWAPRSMPAAADPATTRAEEAKHRARGRCDWHYVSAAVNADGSVAPCCGVWETQDDFGSLNEGRGYMNVVNGESYRAARDRIAGRRAEPTGLVCDECPVPRIMAYAPAIHREIVLLTLVGFVERLRARFALGGRPTTQSKPMRPSVSARTQPSAPSGSSTRR